MITNYFLNGFLDNVIKNPKDLAIEIASFKISYEDIFIEANLLTDKIKTFKLENPIIGVLSYKTRATYISIVTANMLGIPFVPLNKNFPVQRNVEIIKSSGINCLIYDNDCIPFFNLLSLEIYQQNIVSICLPLKSYSKKQLDNKVEVKKDKYAILVNSEDYAYIMFTSGSTGIPKGVPITYQNLVAFLEYCQVRYNINKNDRLSHTFELTFDLSIFDICMALSHGATLVVISQIELISPVATIKNKNISVWFSVPSLAKLAFTKNLLIPGIISNLRLSLFCGEPLFVDLAKAWMQAAPNSRVENLYGPTELTIACSYYDCNQLLTNNLFNHIVPIGTIFEHLDYLILREDMSEAVNGETGHLCIRGIQLFPGYLNNSKTPNQIFINYKEKNYYLTGDLVKFCNGVLQYIGRTDNQVKINGYRIELLEIESCVKNIEGIHDVVVLDYLDNNTQEKKMALFYVSESMVSKNLVYQTLQIKLPKYMIPHAIIKLDNFPTNLNGKVDRHNLRAHI